MKQSKLLLTRMGGAIAAALVASCGGGGGGDGIAFTPPPPVTPPPPGNPGPTSTAVTIFSVPKPGDYASVGASISASGGNLDTYPSASTRFGAVSASDAEQAHIRYSGSGYYEIQMPGQAWDRLVHYKGITNPTADNNYFQPSGVPVNAGFLGINNAAKWSGYTYSEMGIWGSSAASRLGAIAFGIGTPAGGVPTTGSATFDGKVQGTSDIMQADNLYGGFAPMGVDGTVKLSFDFGSGTLAGEMSLFGPDGMNPFKLGTFAFKETVFAVGSTTYSGKFETNAAGENLFLGRFTGPNAQETIGAWAVPFLFTKGGEYTPADGQPHQAFGAWIAKKP
jgi:hypothetical protein